MGVGTRGDSKRFIVQTTSRLKLISAVLGGIEGQAFPRPGPDRGLYTPKQAGDTQTKAAYHDDGGGGGGGGGNDDDDEDYNDDGGVMTTTMTTMMMVVVLMMTVVVMVVEVMTIWW